MRIPFIFLFATMILLSCKDKKKKTFSEQGDPVLPKDTLQTAVVAMDPLNDSLLRKRTHEAILAFKNKDYVALAAMVHPDSGVRFSPYGYIDSVHDRIVTADWISKQATRKEKLLWGTTDAAGDDINTTLGTYIDRYVYDVEFIKPEKMEVDMFMGLGTTLNNLREMYPTCHFTESYFSGFDKKYDGMDWRSLRLVFKMKDGQYYLIGVVHDEWTI
jgi:hypothetical protein